MPITEEVALSSLMECEYSTENTMLSLYAHYETKERDENSTETKYSYQNEEEYDTYQAWYFQ